MKTLTLLRHAKSSWSEAGISDKDRPLNLRGNRDAPVMGRRIKDSPVRPSLILVSKAARAWATAKIIAREISYPREFLQGDDRLYLASVRQILEVLVEQDSGFNSIMVVGHNPGLTELANQLVPDLTPNLPTCGVVAVHIDSEDWNLRGNPPTELVYHDYPKRIA